MQRSANANALYRKLINGKSMVFTVEIGKLKISTFINHAWHILSLMLHIRIANLEGYKFYFREA